MNGVTVYKNFLTPQEQIVVDETILSPCWRYGHSSNGSSDSTSFWQLDGLIKNKFYSSHLLQKISTLTGDSFDVERIYMNGHTAGSHGHPHQDSPHSNGRTFLIYCNKVWQPEMGGATFFQDGDEMESFYPHPYSAIYFQNNIPHFALPVAGDFRGLRVTLAFKLYKK
jgi:Rps23 Pro-64 3,4-dihydroxylase Tpa1-like proline 4-hydroxylase